MSADQRDAAAEEVLRRLHAVAARATRPDLALRAVLAAARVAWPGCRAEVLVRGSERTWTSRLRRPRTVPPLATWPPPLPEGESEPAVRRWQQPLPPRGAHRDRLEPNEPLHPGDAELAAAGWSWRLLVPVRVPGVRAALSVASRSEPPPEALALAEELAAVVGGALLNEARLRRLRRKLDRATRHAERARFVGRLTAGLNRSLSVPDVFRVATERLHRLVPFDHAWLSLLAAEGRDLVLHRLDRSDGFRRMVTQEIGVEGSLLERVRQSRDVQVRVELASVVEPTQMERILLQAGCFGYVLLPLLVRRSVVGTLGLAARDASVLEGEALSLLRHVSGPLAVAVENARLFHDAQERSRIMTALFEVGQALSSASVRKDVTETVLSILHEAFAFRHSAVLTVERGRDGRDWLAMEASRGYSTRGHGALRLPMDGPSITAEAARTGELVYVPDVRADERYVPGVAQGRSEVAIPLVAGGRVFGVLDVESTAVNAFSPEELRTLQLFSTQVAQALHRAAVFEDVRRQAMTDGLTGLLNQRYFNEKVQRELERSARTGRPFTLVLVDVDDLKRINDEHGHVEGNRAIVAVGESMRRHVRSIDAAARFGGDEFALVLSETEGPAARRIVERIQDELRREKLPVPMRITVSAGHATWRPGIETVRDMSSLADQALYLAKGEGKDRARGADEVPPREPAGGAPSPSGGVTGGEAELGR